MKYNCHLNVEVCNTVSSVKYIYKYIHKGHDRVVFTLEPNHTAVAPNIDNNNQPAANDNNGNDEIKKYLGSRYISASEAFWRIFEFDLSYRSPSVTRLPFHEPQQQNVVFHQGLAEQAMEGSKPSELMAYFNQVSSITCYIIHSKWLHHI